MTRQVIKLTLAIDKNGIDPIIELPEGAHFLMLQGQEFDERFMMNHPGATVFDTWWAVETNNAPMPVQLHIRATNDEVPPSLTYLGSFFPLPFEFHVWQKDLVFQDMHIVDGKFIP